MENLLPAKNVEDFLEKLVEGEEFLVSFQKNDGSSATYVATLPQSEKRSHSVAVVTDEGYKRFNVNSVFEIRKV